MIVALRDYARQVQAQLRERVASGHAVAFGDSFKLLSDAEREEYFAHGFDWFQRRASGAQSDA